jgi:RNA polymerase sigma-70 factor, ECF subfamily
MGQDGQAREARFTRLYDAHYAAVRAYAWRRGPDSADDVVAETFTLAWQRLERVPTEPLPWLIGIARNVRLNQERGERRRRDREMRSAGRSAEREDAPAFTEGLEAQSTVADALHRLSERDRDVLLLAAWEGLDRPGLATALSCSKTTAGVRLYRARKRLAAALSLIEAESEGVSVLRGGLLDEH